MTFALNVLRVSIGGVIMSEITKLLSSLAKTSKQGGICSGEKYVEKLKEKIKYVESQNYKDETLWLNHIEEKLLGISLSAPKVESYDCSERTHFCEDFLNGNIQNSMVFALDILQVMIYTTKSGPSEGLERADIIGVDKTGKIKVKIWSSEYIPNKSILTVNNSIILTGKPGFGRYQDFIIATHIKQAI